MTVTPTFRGFGPDALQFFAELEVNNDRTWWLANKPRFDREIAAPMQGLLARLTHEFGRFRVFRMNRDVRFAKDKSPYKTAHAGLTETQGGCVDYVQISSSGLLAGTGIYHARRDQIDRWRIAVADDATGPALEAAVAATRAAGLTVDAGREPPLRTAPRGFDRDHPRIDLLRWKGCSATVDFGAPAWLHTAKAADKVAAAWRSAAPLTSWLDAHVGASQEPPDV